MKCQKHPTYQVIKEPRCECKSCWVMWTIKRVEHLTEKIDRLNRQLEEIEERRTV
jgi:hypothetical protein